MERWSCAAGHTSRVTRHTSKVTRHASPVTCQTSRHTSNSTRHASSVTRHPSLVTQHTSSVTCHTSPVTLHVSPVTLHQRLEATQNVRPTHSTTEKTEAPPPQRGKKQDMETAPNCVHARLLPHEIRASIQSSHPPLPPPYLGNFPTGMLVSEEQLEYSRFRVLHNPTTDEIWSIRGPKSCAKKPRLLGILRNAVGSLPATL